MEQIRGWQNGSNPHKKRENKNDTHHHRTLAATLGHSTLQMILRYIHLRDEHTLKAVGRINSLGQAAAFNELLHVQ